MFVNLLSPVFSCFSTGEFIENDRLKTIVSCLALGILLVGMTYWIYSCFWQNRQVKLERSLHLFSLFKTAQMKDLSPEDERKSLDPQEESELTENTEKENHQHPHDWKKPVSEPLKKTDSDISRKEAIVLPEQDDIFDWQDAHDVLEDSVKIDSTDKKGKFLTDVDVDDYLSDIIVGVSPETDASQKSNFLIQEIKNFAYEGMFTRYEGVKAALQEYEKKNQPEWVAFCNASFIAHHLETKNRECNWQLAISIKPEQRYEAWEIIAQESDYTPLCIQGIIHSIPSEKTDLCPPGKELILFILKKDEDKQLLWLNFLSNLAFRLSEAGIQPDSRPLNSKFIDTHSLWDALIPCHSTPSYFNYRVCAIRVMNDASWNDFIKQYGNSLIPGKNHVWIKSDNEKAGVIKASDYLALAEEQRINPLEITNPFAKLEIVF